MARKQTRGTTGVPSKESAASLYEAGLRHFRHGRYAIAEERIRRALSLDPQDADCLHLAGLLQMQANKIDLAVELVAQAIRINQGDPEYFSSLGTLLSLQDRFVDALKSYNIALQLKPDCAEVWVKVGDLQRRQQCFEEALLAYNRALLIDPRHLAAADSSGSLLFDLQRYAEALARFEQSDTVRPGRSETLFHKGLCLQTLGRLEEAASSYSMSLAANGQNHDARHNLGTALFQMGQYEEATQHFRKVIQIRPGDTNSLSNLGFALTRLKRFDEAVVVLDRATALAPDFAEAINNRGNALRALNRFEQALADYDRALTLKPDEADYHANRAACLDDLLRPGEAFPGFRTALALKPDHADAHWNFALNRLRVGDLKTGWAEAEWRWEAPSLGLRRRHWNRPLWLGSEPIAGKTLLLHNEQGMGDAIQFCRYIPLLAERGAKVVLEIDEPLKELLANTAGVAQCVAKGEALPDHDFHCSLMSLPLAFDTMIDSIPSRVPYISVDGSAKSWNTIIGSADKLRIGVVWSGNPNHTNDRNRSIPLQTLSPLFDAEARFVSLQKDTRESDRMILGEHSGILDVRSQLENFADTAALIQQLDMVISVDTSVAHLAGALGKPIWILLPYVPDYRWLLNRDDSPWYPTARLFRQDRTRDYSSVIARVRKELDAVISAKNSS